MEAVLEALEKINRKCDALDSIEKKLENIESRVKTIEEILQKEMPQMKDSCSNMDDHIQFVEGVYTKIQRPFQRLLPPLNRVLRFSSPEPEPELVD